MAINYFEKETKKAKERFNQTFGLLTVCDLKLRYSTILAICSMTLIGNKVNQAERKEAVRNEIRKFMRIRKAVNTIFGHIETHQKQRRQHETCTGQIQEDDERHLHH